MTKWGSLYYATGLFFYISYGGLMKETSFFFSLFFLVPVSMLYGHSIDAGLASAGTVVVFKITKTTLLRLFVSENHVSIGEKAAILCFQSLFWIGVPLLTHTIWYALASYAGIVCIFLVCMFYSDPED